MVPLGFEPGENPLPVPVPVPTPSSWPIQVPKPIKVKKSFALILEDLKNEKAYAYFGYLSLILIVILPTSSNGFQITLSHQTGTFHQRD